MSSINPLGDEETDTRAAEATECFDPNTESLAAIAESEQILDSGQRRFKTAEDVFEALDI
ncbi:hypothetical protein [Leucobacter sp. OH1287]|uniref:hypothetical protein n=1 Tax=Leucobacter sp. OH1287 TaxID=2491049 RepID=UPI000F5F3B42|nr:hypothetical protein [Leucobacter sp. OH1287]RRD60468.1 hypothetical protein EII30_05700 [Leucobacter sp. OH1287]